VRVAILGVYPLTGNRVTGGPDAVVAQLSRALASQPDTDVHVVVFTGRVSQDTRLERDGVTVHAIPMRRVPRWTMLRVNARALERAVRSIAPDIVHAHSAGTFADAALGSRLPAVITVHGVIQREAQISREYGMGWRERLSWEYEQWYERWCLRRARDVIAISPYVEHFYQGVTTARMHLVENPVAQAYFDLPGQEDPATVLCAARIIPRKNIMTLLQAFARVHRDLPQARLRLAGETHSQPAYAERCRQFVRDQGLEDVVEFLGWLDEPAVQAEYAGCTCVALVSWQETAPVAVEQAMAAGKAVVASDVGGVGHLLAGGQAGLLVEPGDAAGQAAALKQVLEDSGLRRQLGQEARTQALRRFQADAVAARTRSVYEEIIGRQAAGGSGRS
jgi:glycosyltransferase involved in cell wall biosynthesis